jgi:arginase
MLWLGGSWTEVTMPDAEAPKRIELIGLATDAGASARGAVMGPEALRIAGIAEALTALGYTVEDQGDFRPPRQPRDPARRQAEILGVAAEASERAFASLRRGALPIFLGGDHSISMGTVSGVARHCEAAGRELFVLWFDAHGDFNTPGTTPSGNLHGMALAMLCGEPEFADAFGGSWRVPVDPAHVTLFGTRSIDAGERALLESRGIDVNDMRMVDENGATALIRSVIERVEAVGGHLHLSLDIDAMDPSVAPGVGTTVPGGLTYREAHLCMEMLYDSGIVGSVDIVELNPFLDHGGQSATLLVDLAASLFGRQIFRRSPAGRTPRSG